MIADYNTIVKALKNKDFSPIYLIDGEESYYLDKLCTVFENEIVQPSERDFNLTVIYGKDAEWAEVVNCCRRYPMFAERQVVVLKDAAQMKGLNELLTYLENPTLTTVLVIEHRGKKVDGRGKFLKIAKEKGVYFTSEKIKDENLPYWVEKYVKENELKIGQRAAELLASYLGNDLQKIVNEIDKIKINIGIGNEITNEIIKKYVGISKAFNIFEFPETFTNKKASELKNDMLAYFVNTPKAAPMPLLIGTFYNHFIRLYQAQFFRGKSDKDFATAVGLYPNRAQVYLRETSQFSVHQIEQCLSLLAVISTQSVGIENHSNDSALLKDLAGKLNVILGYY